MRAGGAGTILITGGALALEPHAPYASLAIGKAGVRSLALSLAEELEPAGIHVATVTICGYVGSGEPFMPDTIADAYWKLYVQPREAWEREVVYR
jgi:NAD(P)-dependent dehydrogenase (short-subunit alcohol dehydrogenase family)